MEVLGVRNRLPFDPEIPSYKAILNMFAGHGNPDIIKAQASKDATMAHFILKHSKKNHTFLHYNEVCQFYRSS